MYRVQSSLVRLGCRVGPALSQLSVRDALCCLDSLPWSPGPLRAPIADIQNQGPYKAQDQEIRTEEEEEKATPEPAPDDKNDFNIPSWVSTVGGLLAWAVFVGYGFTLSPNQTPARDLYFVEKFFNLAPEDGFHVNTVFTSIFYLFGIVPAIYAPLIIPSARSQNKIPAWPFLLSMVALGNYAFLPYAALWQPDPSVTVPPKKEDLEGWTRVGLRVMESTLLPVLFLFPVSWYLLQMVICGGAEWNDFFKYFNESRLVHNSTVDFISLVLLLPFWMSHDANARQWAAK